MTTPAVEPNTSERMKKLEAAIAKLTALQDEDVEVLLTLAKRERDRRVVDQWLASLAGKILSRGKWIIAVTGMFYFFRDHIGAILVFIIESRGE